jgi:hypothetical protein
MIQNATYRLDPGRAVPIKRRVLKDYLTFTIFTDPLAFLDESPNLVVQTEGIMNLPLNLGSKGKRTYFGNLNASLNFTLINNVNDNSRFAESVLIDDTVPLVNTLDLLKYNNVDFSTFLSVISLELKKQNTYWHMVETGYRFLRSALQVPTTDSTFTTVNPFLQSFQVQTRFEIRPDINLGASLSAGYHLFWLSETEAERNGEIQSPISLSGDGKSVDHVLRTELNAYTFIGQRKKGGLFFRYRGYHSLGKEDNGASGFFPQLTIGYSTNLRTFIKEADGKPQNRR